MVHTEYFLPIVEIKDHNVLIDGRNFFDEPVKNNWRTYQSTENIAVGLGDTKVMQNTKILSLYYLIIHYIIFKRLYFEIQKHYQHDSKFNCIYSRNTLPKISLRKHSLPKRKSLDSFAR